MGNYAERGSRASVSDRQMHSGNEKYLAYVKQAAD